MSGTVSAAETIEKVIETYKSTVFGIALSRTGNREDAEDIFQEVFLLYHRKQPVFNGEEHRKAWLIRATVNLCKKTVSSRKARVELPETAGEDFAFAFALEEENTVFAAMRTLPEKYRDVLHLFYFEALPIAEISAALKTNANTVRVRLKRAREIMREKLKKDYFYE